MCIPNSPRRYCLHLSLSPSLSLSLFPLPLSLAVRVDARKVKTSRNNGRLTSFFNGSCIDSWCTWFRVITRRLAYCAIVGVDLVEPRMGAWCRFDGACRDSPSVVDPLLPPHLPPFLQIVFPRCSALLEDVLSTLSSLRINANRLFPASGFVLVRSECNATGVLGTPSRAIRDNGV